MVVIAMELLLAT